MRRNFLFLAAGYFLLFVHFVLSDSDVTTEGGNGPCELVQCPPDGNSKVVDFNSVYTFRTVGSYAIVYNQKYYHELENKCIGGGWEKPTDCVLVCPIENNSHQSQCYQKDANTDGNTNDNDCFLLEDQSQPSVSCKSAELVDNNGQASNTYTLYCHKDFVSPCETACSLSNGPFSLSQEEVPLKDEPLRKKDDKRCMEDHCLRGAKISLECDPSKKLVSTKGDENKVVSISSTCGVNGVWEATLPEQAFDSEALYSCKTFCEASDNNNIAYTNNMAYTDSCKDAYCFEGDYRKVTCNDGYKLVSGSVPPPEPLTGIDLTGIETCSATGWDTSAAYSCVPACQKGEDITNGDFIENCVGVDCLKDDTRTITCDDGYKLVSGSGSVPLADPLTGIETCSPTGWDTSAAYSCVPACQKGEDITNGKFFHNCGTGICLKDATRTITCNDHYELLRDGVIITTSEERSQQCVADGWEPPSFVCSAKCPKSSIASPTNDLTNGSFVYAGSMCQEDYCLEYVTRTPLCNEDYRFVATESPVLVASLFIETCSSSTAWTSLQVGYSCDSFCAVDPNVSSTSFAYTVEEGVCLCDSDTENHPDSCFTSCLNGAIRTASCKEGYDSFVADGVQDPLKQTCQDAAWTTANFICYPKCAQNETFDNGKYVDSIFNGCTEADLPDCVHFSTRIPQCDEGFRFVSSNSSSSNFQQQCISPGTWAPSHTESFSCVVQCPQIGSVVDGEFTYDEEACIDNMCLQDTKRSPVCASGFKAVPKDTSTLDFSETCLETGHWSDSSSLFDCLIKCDKPETEIQFLNGSFDYPDTCDEENCIAGDQRFPKCDAGYKLSSVLTDDEVFSTCTRGDDAQPVWKDSASFECERIPRTCSIIDIPSDANINTSTINCEVIYENIPTIGKCKNNHWNAADHSDSVSILCDGTELQGKWVIDTKCIPVTCLSADFPLVSNEAHFTLNDNSEDTPVDQDTFSVNDKIRVVCPLNQHSSGEAISTCTPQGQWTTVSECVPTQCLTSDLILSNATSNVQQVSIGAQLEITCNDDTYFSHSDVDVTRQLTCKAISSSPMGHEATWDVSDDSQKTFKCYPASYYCAGLTIDNSIISREDHSDLATLTCEIGYELNDLSLVGSNNIQCLPTTETNAGWVYSHKTSVVPFCVKIADFCPPIAFEHLVIDEEYAQTLGTRVSFGCATHYKPSPADEVICSVKVDSEVGEWVITSDSDAISYPSCVPAGCVAPSSELASFEYSTLMFGDKASYECINNGFLDLENHNDAFLTCTPNNVDLSSLGIWSPTTPACLPDICGPVPVVPFSSHSVPTKRSSLNSSLTYTCANERTLSGSPIVTCGESGWTSPPKCLLPRCDVIPAISSPDVEAIFPIEYRVKCVDFDNTYDREQYDLSFAVYVTQGENAEMEWVSNLAYPLSSTDESIILPSGKLSVRVVGTLVPKTDSFQLSGIWDDDVMTFSKSFAVVVSISGEGPTSISSYVNLLNTPNGNVRFAVQAYKSAILGLSSQFATDAALLEFAAVVPAIFSEANAGILADHPDSSTLHEEYSTVVLPLFQKVADKVGMIKKFFAILQQASANQAYLQEWTQIFTILYDSSTAQQKTQAANSMILNQSIIARIVASSSKPFPFASGSTQIQYSLYTGQPIDGFVLPASVSQSLLVQTVVVAEAKLDGGNYSEYVSKETLGSSNIVGLTFFDATGNEIPVQTQPENENDENEFIYITVPFERDEKTKDAVPQCQYLNEESLESSITLDTFLTEGCQYNESRSTSTSISCQCTHLTMFRATFIPAPPSPQTNPSSFTAPLIIFFVWVIIAALVVVASFMIDRRIKATSHTLIEKLWKNEDVPADTLPHKSIIHYFTRLHSGLGSFSRVTFTNSPAWIQSITLASSLILSFGLTGLIFGANYQGDPFSSVVGGIAITAIVVSLCVILVEIIYALSSSHSIVDYMYKYAEETAFLRYTGYSSFHPKETHVGLTFEISKEETAMYPTIARAAGWGQYDQPSDLAVLESAAAATSASHAPRDEQLLNALLSQNVDVDFRHVANTYFALPHAFFGIPASIIGIALNACFAIFGIVTVFAAGSRITSEAITTSSVSVGAWIGWAFVSLFFVHFVFTPLFVFVVYSLQFFSTKLVDTHANNDGTRNKSSTKETIKASRAARVKASMNVDDKPSKPADDKPAGSSGETANIATAEPPTSTAVTMHYSSNDVMIEENDENDIIDEADVEFVEDDSNHVTLGKSKTAVDNDTDDSHRISTKINFHPAGDIEMV